MTQDFRQQTATLTPTPAQPAPALPAPQRLILRVLVGSSLFFLAAGLGLFFLRPGFLPAEVEPMLAFAFIAVAISDLVAARFLRKVWQART